MVIVDMGAYWAKKAGRTVILVGVFDSARQMDLCTIFKIHGKI